MASLEDKLAVVKSQAQNMARSYRALSSNSQGTPLEIWFDTMAMDLDRLVRTIDE